LGGWGCQALADMSATTAVALAQRSHALSHPAPPPACPQKHAPLECVSVVGRSVDGRTVLHFHAHPCESGQRGSHQGLPCCCPSGTLTTAPGPQRTLSWSVYSSQSWSTPQTASASRPASFPDQSCCTEYTAPTPHHHPRPRPWASPAPRHRPSCSSTVRWCCRGARVCAKGQQALGRCLRLRLLRPMVGSSSGMPRQSSCRGWLREMERGRSSRWGCGACLGRMLRSQQQQQRCLCVSTQPSSLLDLDP
jgi:hypothetical protein